MATIKQKIAFKKAVENHGNISRAMIDAGYDADTAKNPKNLTESNGWQELMDKHLPETLLAKRHRELLNKRDKQIIKSEEGVVEEFDLGPETKAVTSALDMAYKLRGSYAPEKSQAFNLTIEGRISANPELEAVRLKYLEELKSKLKE